MKSRTDNAKRLARAELERAEEMDARLDAMEAAGDVGDRLAWCEEVSPRFDWRTRHHKLIRAELERIDSGEIDRLMLFLPPRHGKSEAVTIHDSAFNLARNPSTRIILGAYNQMLANRFSRRVRRLLKDRVPFARGVQGVQDWETEAGGGLRAVGVGGGVTGMGGDLIIIDDPVKSREEAESEAYRERVWEWYTDDLFTRREPGSAIVLIMTRWHQDDLAGRLLDSEEGDKWTVVSLPAFAEDDDPLGRGRVPCPHCSAREAA